MLPEFIRPEVLRKFCESLLCAAGSDPDEAAVVARVLVWCDRVGRANQGVWRLPILCERLARGLYESPCQLSLEMRTPCLAQMNGRAGQGHFVACRAMEEAIDIARREGMGGIFIRASNFFGAGAYYVNMAAQSGMVGITMSNSFPKVRAYGGERAVLGTNPLAFGCPAEADRPLILDMATSEEAGSTVRRKQELGRRGKNLIEPLAGAKGYGLALMVEVLSGVLASAGFSHQVNSMYENFQTSGDNGHFLLAIDIERLLPMTHFQERMGTLLSWLRGSGGQGRVRYPGEHRWEALEQSDSRGIRLDPRSREALSTLAQRFDVDAGLY